MARSPLSRNRAFERIAIPVLLILFLTVAARQLRTVVSHNDQVHIERAHEHRVYHADDERRERRRQHREAVARIELENEREVEIMVQID